jgi:hypothetical protein
LSVDADDDDFESAVRFAVQRDLDSMPESVQNTTEAATALALAREMDMGRQLSIAPVAKELRGIMELLRSWATAAAPSGDAVDDLAAARAARRAGAAG